MDNVQPTRRGMLGILATGPVAMLPALSVMQCSGKAQAATSGNLDAAIAHFRATQEAYAAFDEKVHGPALKAYVKALDAVPHRTTEASFMDSDGLRKTMSTADASVVKIGRKLVRDNAAKYPADPDYERTLHELVALADDRDIDLQAIKVQHRVAEMHNAEMEYAERVGDAQQAVIELPVTSLADLSTKLEFVDEQEAWELPYSAPAIMSDVQRLAALGSA